jgi:hypothetical protein
MKITGAFAKHAAKFPPEKQQEYARKLSVLLKRGMIKEAQEFINLLADEEGIEAIGRIIRARRGTQTAGR